MRVTPSNPLSPHRLQRRDVLRVGVSAGTLGLGLPAIFARRALARDQGQPSLDTAVIQIWLGGGPSHFETYDPKPEAPAEVRGPYGPIATRLPGVRFCELLPRQAAIADKLAVVRSVRHTTDDHYAGMHWCLTAHPTPANSATASLAPARPAAGAVAAALCGGRRAGLPPYIHLGFKSGNPAYDGNHHAAYLGQANNPFRVTDDPSDPAFRLDNLALADGLSLERLEDRRLLHGHFDRLRRDLDARGTIRSLDRFQQLALGIVAGPAARRAFDLAQEDPRLRDRYGRHRWGQSALLARRLVESGVTFVTVNTDPHSFTWDMHGSLTTPGIDSNARTLPEVAPLLDQMVSALVEDLLDRGLDRRVLVVVWGEFGRTPRVNATGGRDHWGAAKGESPSDRPLWPHDVAATIYRHLGIDPATSPPDLSGRPIPVLADGEPIRELL
jgi:hypothetical protein